MEYTTSYDFQTTRDANTTSIPPRTPYFLFTRGVAVVTTVVLGAMVNLTALVILCRSVPKLNTQLFMVANMCASYLTYSVLSLPYYGAIQLNQGQMFDSSSCVVHAYLSYGLSGWMILSLLFITMHRYFIIICPNSETLRFGSKKRSSVILVTTIGCFFIFLLPPTFGLFGQYGYEPRVMNCALLREQSRTFNMICLVLAFFLPLLTKLVAYIHIFVVVYRQGKKMAQGQKDDKKVKARRKREVHLTVLSCTLVLTFVGSYFPYFLSTMNNRLEHDDHYFLFACIVVNMHILINPCIYVFGDPRIKNYVKSITIRAKGKRINVEPITFTSVA